MPKLCKNYIHFGKPYNSYTCKGCENWKQIDTTNRKYLLEDGSVNCHNFEEVKEG